MIKDNTQFLIIFFIMCSLTVSSFASDCERSVKEWLSCEQDSDCVLVKGACSFPVASNKEFSQEEEKRQNCLSAAVECAKPSEGHDSIEFAARCENQKCIVRQK